LSLGTTLFMRIHTHRGEDIDVSSADSNEGNLETYEDRRKM